MSGGPRTPDARARELAKIHIGRKALGLDEQTYRAMLMTLTGAASAGKLDAAGRRKVIESLKRDGAFDDRKPRLSAFDAAWAACRARVPDFRRPPPAATVSAGGARDPDDGGSAAEVYDDQKALYLAGWFWLGENGHLWSEHWRSAGETTFVMRTVHVAHLRFATPAQTAKLVEAVKAMVRRAVDGAAKGRARR